jgi:tRNA 2-thiouridine synthesizing protein A
MLVHYCIKPGQAGKILSEGGNMTNLKSMKPAETLDVQGMACPHPLITVKKAMEKLSKGEVLKILCDSASTAEDAIPRYCEKNGYEFESIRFEENSWELYIKKT